MVYDIVYVCNSINNKNIRGNELKILRKLEDQLCFEFGESENNIKKRFYKDVETLNEDYSKIEEIKAKLEEKKVVEEEAEITSGYAEVLEPIESPRIENFKRKKGKRTF